MTSPTRLAKSFVLLLGLFLSVSSFAASPLDSPLGLAVDANGNLYVANAEGNDILIYSPTYTQTATITQNISDPNAVAFDSYGNLWVTNAGAGTLTVYNSAGQQGGTLSLATPFGLAIDGLNNLWIVNYTNTTFSVAVLDAFYSDWTSGLFSGSNPINVAAQDGWIALTTPTQTYIAEASRLLQSGTFSGTTVAGAAIGVAADKNHNFYIARDDGSTVVFNIPAQSATSFVNLGFQAYGVAVDSKRGRVYFSDGVNRILVYSTAGKLLHTIK